MNQNLLRSILTIFSSKVGVLLLTVVTTPILVRLLGSNGYGDYSFLLSTLQWLLVFVYAGSFKGIRKHIAEDQDREAWADNIFAFYLQIVTGTAIGVCILIIIIAPTEYIRDLLGDQFTYYFYIIAFMTPLRAFFRTARSGLMGLGLEHRSEPLRVVDRLMFAGIIVGLSYMGGSVLAVLVGRTATVGLVAVIATGFLARNIRISSIFVRTPTMLPRKNY